MHGYKCSKKTGQSPAPLPLSQKAPVQQKLVGENTELLENMEIKM